MSSSPTSESNGVLMVHQRHQKNNQQEELVKKAHDDCSDGERREAIQVAIRMRPMNSNEDKYKQVWKILKESSSITQTTTDGEVISNCIPNRSVFTFDQTFDEDTTTRQVYNSSVKGIVSSVLTGMNGTIFAYGQTSSGKTYTMQGCGTIQEGASGSDGNAGDGTVHMAASDIFQHIANNSNRVYLVRLSFVEIYNEEVRDLLSGNKTVKIREDPIKGIFLTATNETVTDLDSLLSVLFRGEKARSFASTTMNERSSRSHTLFRITIESRPKAKEEVMDNMQDDEDKENIGEGDEDEFCCDENDDDEVLVSTLNLVDLAGSESVRHTGATGDRQKESGMINQSLLTLSRVINALGKPNQMHINFRDSKLTRILQPSLSGNSRMVVICCITPSELYLEETRSTLQFASRAKLVKMNPQKNTIVDDKTLIRRLERDLARARRMADIRSGGSSESHFERSQQTMIDKKVAIAYDAYIEEAVAKRKVWQECVLNSGLVVNSKAGSLVSADESSRKRHRRNCSDGLLVTAHPHVSRSLSPCRKNASPRFTKKSRTTELLSRSEEVEILLEAKSARISLIEKRLKDKDAIIQKKDAIIEENMTIIEDTAAMLDMERRKRTELEDNIKSSKQDNILLNSQMMTFKKNVDDMMLEQQSTRLGMEGMKLQLEGMKQQIGDLSNKCNESNLDFVSLKGEFRSTQSLANEVVASLTSVPTKVDSLQGEVHKLRAELAKTGMENRSLLNDRNAMAARNVELGMHLQQYEKNKHEIQVMYEEMKRTLDNERQMKEVKIMDLKTAQEKIINLEDEIKKHNEVKLTRVGTSKDFMNRGAEGVRSPNVQGGEFA